jgi:ribonuclease P protein component
MVKPSPQRFPKTARLRAAPEFQAVFKNGLKHSGVFFRLYYLADPALTQSKLGLAVPKKMAPLAVTRNRIKRVCRETFRQWQASAKGDLVLVAQAKAKTASNIQLRAELKALLLQISVPTNE